MSSTVTVCNHKNLQPTNGGMTARLNETLETIRQEFDTVLHDNSVLKSQCHDYEDKLTTQVNQVKIIRQRLCELEAQHSRIRQQQEEELLKLRNELYHAHQQAHNTLNPLCPPGPGPASAQPSLSPLQQAPSQLQSPPQPPPQQAQSPLQPLRYPGEPYSLQERPCDHNPRDLGQRERECEREREHEQGWYRDLAQRDPKRIKPAPQSHQQVASPQPYGALELEDVPSEYKKHGQDWLAVSNPRVPPVLEVNLMHAFSHESVVCCVRFSADGQFLATGCNRSAQIYDIKTGQKLHVLVDESARKTGGLYIRSVCFSPNGKYLATGGEDKQIRIWDIAKKRIRTVFTGHSQEIHSLDFSADGAFIVSGSGDKTARIWPMEGNGSATVLAIDEPENVDAGVTSVAISPDGRFVVAGSLDTVIRIWDVATGSLIERLQGHKDSVYSVAFTLDGQGLVSGSLDKSLKLWDVAPLYRKGLQALDSGKTAGKQADGEPGCVCLMDYKGRRDYVLSVAVSHDGQWIVSGSKDRGVQFYNARNAAVQLTLQGHKNSVVSIDLSPTSGMLATGSGDSQARVWRFGPQG